jgi:hypothetical protein
VAKAKKKSPADVQKELRELAKPNPQAEKPPVDLSKMALRVAGVLAVVWFVAVAVASFIHSRVPIYLGGILTAAAGGVFWWAKKFMAKQQALGALLREAETEEGRKEAIAKIDSEFKNDTQATLAKAQLLMQEDPRKALEVLESINLDKQMAPVAGQVRAMRAMIHLTLGETAEARTLADQLDLGKQQEPKTRALFATVAGEAWGRTGNAKKAVEVLELFNPDDPEYAELKMHMWRARAFAYASNNDIKGAGRALKKLAELNPHLLAQFLSKKKIHPLLEREARQIVMQAGVMPRKMVRQKA